MTFAEIAVWVGILTPVVFAFMVIFSKSSASLLQMVARVWESIMILAGKPKPVVEGNVKMTLDEMGITLWEASDAHYDKAQMDRIRKAHNWEHAQWTTDFNKLNRLLAPPVDEDDSFDIWDEDADETLLIQQCQDHSDNEVCIYCDPQGMQPVPRKKRQRRRR